MRFIYFGSSQFSRTVLEALYLEGVIPILIVSQPDKPQGRGLKVLPTLLSLFAQEKKIPLIKPVSFNDEEVKKKLESEMVDFFLVVDYGKILPSFLLSFPKLIPLGLHPSLLPRYRGPAPINWAIINAETQTGVTVFKINEKVDGGEIILQKKVSIDDNDDIVSLTYKLGVCGAFSLREAMEKIEKKDYTLTPQEESLVSFAPKLKKEDGRINWKLEAKNIRNLIRGTLIWPSAYTFYKDKMLKILEVDTLTNRAQGTPGTIVKIDRQGIYVVTQRGILRIKKLKPQSKKEMDAWSFVLGYGLKVGESFS